MHAVGYSLRYTGIIMQYSTDTYNKVEIPTQIDALLHQNLNFVITNPMFYCRTLH